MLLEIGGKNVLLKNKINLGVYHLCRLDSMNFLTHSCKLYPLVMLVNPYCTNVSDVVELMSKLFAQLK